MSIDLYLKQIRYDATDPSLEDAVDPDGVIIADGWERTRLVTLANGQLPGPPIVVYKGQEVIIFVENDLEGRETTIHWHGFDQRGTPWMDGVPYINQCLINGLQRFKYSFIADEAGTFWWHSHVGSQRSDGLYGALIVKEREELLENQHIMIVQEWNHDGDADYIRENIGANFDERVKWPGFQTLDNLNLGPYRAHSVVINGRARFSDDSVTIDTPLTRFMVEEGDVYRFRVITAAAFYPIRISVDNHQLELIASDGNNLKSQPCDSFIIYPGQRFDFLLHANQEPGIYWIRALLAVKPFSRAPLGEAILKYKGAPGRYPQTSQNCTAGCYMANCPYDYKSYQPYPNTSCISVNKFRGAAGLPSTPQYEAGNFRQFILNFGFVEGRASVNGLVFKSPTVNSYTQPKDVPEPCDEVCTDEIVCECFHVIKFPGGAVVQIVLTNLVKSLAGTYSEPHPIHIHGHHFHVVKIGFPTYNETNGEIIAGTPDIVCEKKMARLTGTAAHRNGRIPLGRRTYRASLDDPL